MATVNPDLLQKIMGFYDYGAPDLKTWSKDEKVPKQPNKASIKYMRELRGCIEEFAKNNVALYFLITRLGIVSCRTMLISGGKQREFMCLIDSKLKVRAVTAKYAPIFDRSIEGFHRRADYVWKIIKENVRLTEYGPFFLEGGYDRLIEHLDLIRNDSFFDDLEQTVEVYQAEHADEIAAYMESIKEEKEVHETAVRLRKEKIKAEKALTKELNKKARTEHKAQQSERKKQDLKAKRLDASFNHLYKEADRYWQGR